MRKINKIIIHCSDTPVIHRVYVSDIDKWHRLRGFDCIGYHYFIRYDGTIDEGRPLDRVGAHCKGQNAYSIGICYEGGRGVDGKPQDTRSDAQEQSLVKLITELRDRFGPLEVFGHRDFANKACPCFDAHSEYNPITRDLQLFQK